MRRFVLCKHDCDREYENGDHKPDPSPDILLNRDSHRFTLTVPKTAECCRMRKRTDSSDLVLWILMGAIAIAAIALTSGSWSVSTRRRINPSTRSKKKVAAKLGLFRTGF